MRKLLIIIAIIFLLVCIALLILTRNADQILIKVIEHNTGGEVTLEEFKFNLFTGFHLKNLTLKFPQDTVIQSIEEIVFTYKPLQLLKRRLYIDGFVVKSPRFELYQKADGSWNLPEELLAKMLQPQMVDGKPVKFSLPLNLSITMMEVQDFAGRIRLPGMEAEVALENIETEIRNLKSIDNIALQTSLSGGALEVSLDSPGMVLRLDFAFEGEIEDSLGSFKINSQLGEKTHRYGSFPPLESSVQGSLNISSQSLKIERFQIQLFEGEGFKAAGDLSANLEDNKVHFDSRISVADFRIKNSGFITELKSKYFRDLPDFNFLFERPAEVVLRGEIDPLKIKYDISGKLSQQSKISAVRFKEAGTLIDELTVKSDLRFSLSDSVLNLEGVNLSVIGLKAENFGLSIPQVDLRLNSRILYKPGYVHLDAFNAGITVFSPQVVQQNLPEVNINSLTATMELAGGKMLSLAQIFGFQQAVLKSTVELIIPPNLLNFEPGLALLKRAEFTAEDVNLSPFTEGKIAGSLAGEMRIENQGDFLEFAGAIKTAKNLTFNLGDSVLVLPFKEANLKGNIELREDFRQIILEKFVFNIDDWMNGIFAAQIADYEKISLQWYQVTIKPEAVLSMESIAKLIPLETDAVIKSEGRLNVPLKAINSSRGDFKVKLPAFGVNAEGLTVSGIEVSVAGTIEGYNLTLQGATAIDSIKMSDLRKEPVRGLNSNFSVKGTLLSRTLEFTGDLILPREAMKFAASGKLTMFDDSFNLVTDAGFSFSDSAGKEIIPNIIIAGALDSELKITLDSTVSVTGYFRLHDFSLSNPLFQVNGVGGEVPIKQRVKLSPFDIYRAAQPQRSFYQDMRPYLRANSAPVNNVKAKSIVVFEREMTDISGDVYWDDSYLQLPHFQLSLFEGNLAGSGWLRVDSLAGKVISYQISAQGAEINSDKISQLRQKSGESSKISFNFAFLGVGLVPTDPNFKIEGSMHITKISAKVAENLLYALDPQQRDKGIQSALYFLRRGWGVRNMSFEVAHGFVYGTIMTQQPPLKKPLPFLVSKLLPIEKEIRLSRLPLKFFLK